MLRRLAISALLIGLAVPAVPRTRAAYGGTLRVEVESDALPRHGGLARSLLFDGLTRMASDGSSQPALAVRWSSENSAHRWQFWLRPGVRFHDGSPLTAAAVESSLTASCGGGCPWSAVHAVGSSVVFSSDSPLPNLPTLLAEDEFLIVQANSNNPGAAAAGAVGSGTGPFQPGSSTNGQLMLTANDTCWQGRPFLDAIEISGHKSIRDQWLDLSVGRTDLVEVPPEQIRQAQQQRFTVVVSPPVTLLALAVADSGPLANPNLRTAIALSVDRGALFNVIFRKQGEITGGLLPSEVTGYGFLFSPERDLNKAHELRGGLTASPLTLSTDGAAIMQLAAQRVALDLREGGFNVQTASTAAAHHSDLVLLRLTLVSNQPQPALEALLRNAGVATSIGEEDAAGLYRDERAFLDAHKLIPLIYLPRSYAIGGRVRDFHLGVDGMPLLAGASLQDTH